MHRLYACVIFLVIFDVISGIGVSRQDDSAVCRTKNKNNIEWSCEKTSDCKFSPDFADLESQQKTVCGNAGADGQKICCPHKADPYEIAKKKCQIHAKNRWTHGILADIDGKSLKYEICKIQKNLSTNAEPVSAGELPHMVLLGTDDKKPNWFCAGTIISPQYVLTAAHCNDDATFFGSSLKPAYALVGTLAKPTDLASVNSSNLIRIVERINYPEYKPPHLKHDIALLKLERPLDFNEFVQPVCLVEPNPPIHKRPYKKAVLSGWGRPMPDEPSKPDVMVKTRLDFQNSQVCESQYKNHSKYAHGFNDTTMICAGDLIFSRTKCQTDTGGPLQKSHWENDYGCVWLQEGVISFGPMCGIKEPAVYTRVTHYLPWIQPIVWPAGHEDMS